MARPKASELTPRELDVMHVFWELPDANVQQVQERLKKGGQDLAYTTVATLIKILDEKGFIQQLNDQRPFIYKAKRSFDEVSNKLVTDLVARVFRGSSEQLLLRLIETRKLTRREIDLLEEILRSKET